MKGLPPIRVEYWEKWGGHEGEAIAAIAHSFNESQGAYEVVMKQAGDWSSSPDLPSFLRAQDEGAPPDLIGLEDHQIVDLAVKGALAPLRDLVEHPWYVGYDDRFRSLGEHHGTPYGVPISADIATLYVNLESVWGTAFEAGKIPSDISKFDAGLEELRSLGWIGFVPTYPGWWPHAWPWFFGGSWFDSGEKFTPDNPRNIRAYEWVCSIRERWDLKAFDKPINPVGARRPDPFLDGEVATVLDGDWLVSRLLQANSLKWVPAPFPTVDGEPAALMMADVLSVPEGAPNPEGASEFISFVSQPEQIERLALAHRKISPLKLWSKRFLSQHPNPKLSVLREIVSSARLFSDPRITGWIDYRDRIEQAFTLIWSGKQSPESALTSIR